VTPRQLPASIGDFTGRENPLIAIKQVLGEEQDAGASHAVRIAAISGKGGVGKSTLAIRAAHELSSAFPDGHLYAGLGATPSQVGEDRTAVVLARFLHALGVNGAAVPDDLEERIEQYRSRVAGKRLLVVLDDVTDEEQVRPLLPGSPTCAVIMTSRTRLTGLSGTYRIDLEVFDVDKSLELLGKIIGADRLAAEHDAAVELVNSCAGLPLALRIAGARLASRQHWRIGTLVQRLGNEAHRLDELSHHGLELRSNIGLTYRALDERAKLLFRLFALIRAPDFPGWSAAALLDTNLIDAENVVERLVDAQLLDAVSYPGAYSSRYRFHDLIRVYAREQLMDVEPADDRQQALSRMLGAWLALAEQAHRIEYGGDYTILPGTAPRWHPPEGRLADLLGSPREWWETECRGLVAAAQQAAAEGLDELCWDLALTLVTSFEAKGLFDDWRETSQQAYDLAVRAGNRLGRAAMLYSLGTLDVYQKRLVDAERAFTEASELFAAEGNRHGYALAVRNWALVDRLRGDFDAMLDKYARALDLMRLVGDRIGEAHILSSLAKHRIDEGEFEVAEQLLDRAAAICREQRCARVEAQVLYRSAELYLGTDQIELARQVLHRVLRLVRDLGDRIGEAYTLYGLGAVRLREGRLSNAETTLLHTLGLARRVGERLVEGQALYALAELELAKGHSVAVGRRLAEATAVFDELGSKLWRSKAGLLRSELDVISGDTAAAVRQLAVADALLAQVQSKESRQLRTQLARRRSALLDSSPVGSAELRQP
jgi:tetratricopeptide (TPR) repeat protein